MREQQYIIRETADRIVTAVDYRVLPVEKNRVKSVHHVPGFGDMREVEGTGEYASDLLIIAAGGEGREVFDQFGRLKKHSGVRRYVDRSYAAVKGAIRRLRPEEGQMLAQLDVQIATAENVLHDLRRQRAELVKVAWSKAHAVRLNEVESKLEKP